MSTNLRAALPVVTAIATLLVGPVVPAPLSAQAAIGPGSPWVVIGSVRGQPLSLDTSRIVDYERWWSAWFHLKLDRPMRAQGNRLILGTAFFEELDCMENRSKRWEIHALDQQGKSLEADTLLNAAWLPFSTHPLGEQPMMRACVLVMERARRVLEVAPSRIEARVDTLESMLVRAGRDTVRTGRAVDAITRERRGGQDVIVRRYDAADRRMGTRNDSLVIDAGSLAPVRRPPVAETAFDSLAFDLVLRAAPLTVGWSAQVPILREAGEVVPVPARVVARDSIRGRECWRVDAHWQSGATTYWIDVSSHALCQLSTEVQPDVVFVVRPVTPQAAAP